MANVDHAQALSLITGKSSDELRALITSQPMVDLENTIRHENLDMIKKILRYYKNEIGYNSISLSQNKSQLVGLLAQVIMKHRNQGNGQVPAPQVGQQQISQQERIRLQVLNQQRQQQQHEQHLRQLQQQRQQQQQQQQQPEQQQQQQGYQHPHPPQQLAPAAISGSNGNASGQQVPNQQLSPALRAEMNTAQKMEIYKELLSFGFTCQEAAEGIRDALEEDLEDLDMLVYKLACKKNGDEVESSSSAEDKELQEQEDRDMDQAILNSESEREVIGDRKKRRVLDIGSDCTCPLGDAFEFRNSLLVGRMELSSSILCLLKELGWRTPESESKVLLKALQWLDKQTCKKNCLVSECAGALQPSSSSSSSSSSSNNLVTSAGVLPSSSSSSSSSSDNLVPPVGVLQPSSSSSSSSNNLVSTQNSVDIPTQSSSTDINIGGIVEGIITDISITQSNSNKYEDDSKCSCPELYQKLRSQLTRLLLLELDAMKFSKENCHAYFLELAQRIDAEFSVDMFTSVNFLSSSPTADSSGVITLNFVACCNLITQECEVLEKALYSLPEDGSSVPRIFREADPVGRGSLDGTSKYSVDDDGFEFC